MIYVVGSGPAGVACAHALVGRGVPVTMLDAGVEMEPELRQVLAGMREQPPSDWSAASLARIKQPTAVSDRAIPLKSSFSSLFPYQHAPTQLAVETDGVDALPSYARGGFSNVWGATVLPYAARDIADWPFGPDDLAPHYRVVAELLHVAERRDRLARELPLFSDGMSSLRSSRQADALMRDLEAHADALEADGWRFGYSRLALRSARLEGVEGRAHSGQASAERTGCVYCGLCLYGCPYGHIYNALETLERLQRSQLFSYRPNVVVSRLTESAGAVRIHAESRRAGDALSFDAERVFLAAGAFNTTAILLASLEAYDTPVSFLDSQLFLLPVLRYRAVRGVAEESLHALSQLFVEIMNPQISARTVHLQVYSYNDWYAEAVRRRVGALFPLARPWLRALLERLMVVQGYLPSDLSPRIRATLRRRTDGSTLALEPEDNPRARPAIAHIVDALKRHRGHLRAVPLTPLLEIGAAGRSYHTGGSFPMRSHPARFESDRWGRPHGFERVHAVDATVFPSIPAGPITFSVMANAHRIASEPL
jgi:choline dehydrogenase-like flavoprotein